ncbi:MAG: serine protease [Deltaproteobacteria bacterium]|nr:MAG: serine protease [Deltaproteobacteria bacterium]
MIAPYPQVVRVYATVQEHDYDCPWQAMRSSNSTGSGVIVGPTEILTGAHVVANATFIQVQTISDPNKAVARVKAVCHDADLALLCVEDESFFRDIDPAQLGELPHFRDKVSVVGFPMGGEELSITEGIVSRIEVQRYYHSQRYLLAVTVDAAINAGNSGGPVFRDDKVVGIAFQKISGADNIGEMVPAPIIRTFLEGVKQNKPSLVPGLGVMTQNLENPQLRSKIGLPSDLSGILVNQVEYGSSVWGVVKPRDAILAVDGMPIANNGTIMYRARYRTRFDVVLGNYHVGDELSLVIWRDGQSVETSVVLQESRRLVPRCQYDIRPHFFVYGGMVFQPLTYNFLASWDTWWEKAPSEFVQAYYYGVRSPGRHSVVVLSQILSDKVNVGYNHLYNESVVAINGRTPKGIADFARQLDSAQGIVEIGLSSGSVIVFDSKEAKEAGPSILTRYHIPSDRSEGLLSADLE